MLRSVRRSSGAPGYELVFHYVPSDGWLYRWDARCKWIFFLCLSTLTLQATHIGLLFTTLLIATAFISHKGLIRCFRMPPVWWYLLALIFLMNAVNIPPTEGQLITREGLRKGVMVCWKLMTLVSLAVILTATTSPSETVRAINSFLRFVPLRWNHRLTTMITLTLRFVPYLMSEYRKIELAAYARTGALRPGFTIRYILPSFVRRSLLAADDIATALKARGYREDLPVRTNPCKKQDIFALIALLVFAILTFAIDRLSHVKLP